MTSQTITHKLLMSNQSLVKKLHKSYHYRSRPSRIQNSIAKCSVGSRRKCLTQMKQQQPITELYYYHYLMFHDNTCYLLHYSTMCYLQLHNTLHYLLLYNTACYLLFHNTMWYFQLYDTMCQFLSHNTMCYCQFYDTMCHRLVYDTMWYLYPIYWQS